MRKYSLMLLAAVVGLAASQASAADLPRKAPAYIPPPPPPVTWTGCYIGGNIGGAFGDASVNFPGGEVSSNGSGFAGGGQIGCDYQFSGGWLSASATCLTAAAKAGAERSRLARSGAPL